MAGLRLADRRQHQSARQGLARAHRAGPASYPYLAAPRADLLQRVGDRAQAVAAYEEALLLTENGVDLDLLATRLRELRE